MLKLKKIPLIVINLNNIQKKIEEIIVENLKSQFVKCIIIHFVLKV